MNNFIDYLRKIKRYIFLPLWFIYKIKYRLRSDKLMIKNDAQPKIQKLHSKEDVLQGLLAKNKSKSFLEIGIGQFPQISRLELIIKNNIKYTGLDFTSVCDDHLREVKRKGLNYRNIKYLGNHEGAYTWTLFQLFKNRKKFDIIYLDGHHTFYVDLPAIFLIDLLLKKSGLLIIDDINWTLSFLQKNMASNYLDWYFYRNMYDFSQYNYKQQHIPHIKMITEEIMLKHYNYKRLEQYRMEDTWVLVKTN